MDYKNELTIEMLPDEGRCKDIAERIGMENFLALAEILGGVTFYIPKLDSLLKPVRDQHIKNDFNGYNHYDLAMKYNISERWIRELCGEGVPEGQIALSNYNT